jgi:hypothetical protein
MPFWPAIRRFSPLERDPPISPLDGPAAQISPLPETVIPWPRMRKGVFRAKHSLDNIAEQKQQLDEL